MRLSIMVGLFALATFTGCDNSNGSDPDSVAVVATTTHLADFTRNVGGERVEVDQLLDTNADPHDYEFLPSDAEDVAEADLILRGGLGIDDWVDELLDNAAEDALVVDTSDGLVLPGDSRGEIDPHIWFNPEYVLTVVDNIEVALAEVDPDGADKYRANASTYKNEIRAMATEVEETFSNCDADQRKLVTSHDALGHLAERFDLEVVGAVIPSLETTAEPSASDIGDLIELIDELGVPAIFSEASVSTELETQVADETDAEVVADLYVDSLGPEGSPAETYISMMEYNADRIVEGLGCAWR